MFRSVKLYVLAPDVIKANTSRGAGGVVCTWDAKLKVLVLPSGNRATARETMSFSIVENTFGLTGVERERTLYHWTVRRRAHA